MQGSRARLSVWIALRSDLSSQRIKHTRHHTNVRFWHNAHIGDVPNDVRVSGVKRTSMLAPRNVCS